MNVLLTGSAGRIGSDLLPVLRARHTVRTFDRQPGADVVANLTDAKALQRACVGIEVIVHLAASKSDQFPFAAEIVPNNIVGLYNLLEAARDQRVRRVVFASSIQTVDRYPQGQTVTVTDPVRPVGPYGATKIFGEALGRVYHDTWGLEFIAIRLGGYQPYDSEMARLPWAQAIWLSPRDAGDLFCRAVETPGIGYAIVNGTSHTVSERLSRREARELLGYEPHDRWEDHFGGRQSAGPA